MFLKTGFFQKLHPYAISICATVILFRDVIFSRSLPGDEIDGRLTYLLVNHWYNFLKGNAQFLSPNFFYPSSGAIGYSDGFLVTGLINAFLRFVGIDSLMSWKLSMFVIVLAGLIFFIKIISLLELDFLIKLLASIAIVSSYPLAIQSGHTQTFAFFGFFPVVWFFINTFWENKFHKLRFSKRYFVFTVISLELFALTSWYGAFFTFALLCFCIVTFLFYLLGSRVEDYRKFLSPRTLWKRNDDDLSNIGFSISFLIIASLAFLFVRIYLPVKGDVIRTYGEFIFYAPRIGDLLNTSYEAQGIHFVINQALKNSMNPTFERALGFPLFTLSMYFLLLALIIFGIGWRHLKHRALLATFGIVIILISLIPVSDEFGRSLWGLIWKFIPLADSIRIPFRIMVLVSWLITLFVCLASALYRKDKRAWISKAALLVFLVVSIFDSSRPLWANWTEDDFKPSYFNSAEKLIQINNCKTFFIQPNPKIKPSVEFHLDAMVIADYLDVPTINGYSGGWPKNWPIDLYWGGADKGKIEGWLNAFDKTSGNFCYLTIESKNSAKLEN